MITMALLDIFELVEDGRLTPPRDLYAGLHAELASFQTEADCVKKKLLKVEDDLVKYKSKNLELNEELLKSLGKVNTLRR